MSSGVSENWYKVEQGDHGKSRPYLILMGKTEKIFKTQCESLPWSPSYRRFSVRKPVLWSRTGFNADPDPDPDPTIILREINLIYSYP